MHDRDKLFFIALTLGLALAGTQGASALTKEEAIENCRATVGRPLVEACMRGGRGESRETCRAQPTPKVRECVIAALNKANARANVPVEAPKEQAPSAAVGEQDEGLDRKSGV